MKEIELTDLSDENLIQKYREGDVLAADCLIERYKARVKRKARAMFLVGGETDDLIQEGMIGLYKAIRDYDTSRDISFLTFAKLCMDRQMYTAIEASNRKKHSPLNSYIPIQLQGKNSEEELAVNNGDTKNPEEMYIDKENVMYIEKLLKEKLSDFEYIVIIMYIDGMSYQEIARETGKSPKSIDNALQRIKNKIIRALP